MPVGIKTDRNKEPLVWAVENNTPEAIPLPKFFSVIEDKEYSKHVFDENGKLVPMLANGKPIYALDENGQPTDAQIFKLVPVKGTKLREDIAFVAADAAEIEDPQSINANTKEQLDAVRYRTKDGKLDMGNKILAAENMFQARIELRGYISYIKAQAENKSVSMLEIEFLENLLDGKPNRNPNMTLAQLTEGLNLPKLPMQDDKAGQQPKTLEDIAGKFNLSPKTVEDKQVLEGVSSNVQKTAGSETQVKKAGMR